MSIYLVLGTVFVSVFLFVFVIGLLTVVRKSTRSTVASRLSSYGMKKEEEAVSSFSDRVLIPVLRRIADMVKKISPRGVVESTSHKLELAGILEVVGINVYFTVKFLFPILFLIIYILLMIFFDFSLMISLLLLIPVPISYFLPDMYLRSKISNRQDEIRRALPNALDMLTITVEAGMGFDAALSRVASNIRGPLGEELGKMLKDMNVGIPRREAFRNLVNRTNVQDLDSFISAVIQAEILGISIGKILRTQASELRNKRSNRAEEAGIKAPLKLIFPLITCLLLSLLIVILGPGIITVFDALKGFLL
jgi:tight adherence protein C